MTLAQISVGAIAWTALLAVMAMLLATSIALCWIAVELAGWLGLAGAVMVMFLVFRLALSLADRMIAVRQ